MSIGYACLTVGVPFTNQKSCMIKNANESKLLEIIEYNLRSLENVIDYNIKNNIKLYRISSDLIPFGSSTVNRLPWWNIYTSQLTRIGETVRQNSMRLSMHPGQYTVLNSPNVEVVARAIDDLNYHAKVLDSLGLGTEHKIVLHIGGVYNEKKQALNRFICNYNILEDTIKSRLVIENDDKSYTISEVLEIGKILNIPVIFDNLHNMINPSLEQKSELYWIEECKKTWKEKDGQQKIHYSQQNPIKNPGSHSTTILINEFMSFYEKINRIDLDIMLEVKDKNLSAVKCINCTSTEKNINFLEVEWNKYKYTVLENDHTVYSDIRKLLQDKEEYPAVPFYTLIETALQKERTIGNSINAAQHIWGYFNDIATEKEKNNFLESIESFSQGKVTIQRIKNNLWRMAEKYQRAYLLDSFYFVL